MQQCAITNNLDEWPLSPFGMKKISNLHLNYCQQYEKKIENWPWFQSKDIY
jgi:hypothetical protein